MRAVRSRHDRKLAEGRKLHDAACTCKQAEEVLVCWRTRRLHGSATTQRIAQPSQRACGGDPDSSTTISQRCRHHLRRPPAAAFCGTTPCLHRRGRNGGSSKVDISVSTCDSPPIPWTDGARLRQAWHALPLLSSTAMDGYARRQVGVQLRNITAV